MGNLPSPPQCVALGIKEYLNPYIQNTLVNVVIKELCNRDDVLGIYLS